MLQEDGMPVDEAPADEGEGAPRQSYNFAPGYHGIVYRADVPKDAAATDETRYKLQSMKWGLIPSWTKRNPDYAALMKTINCRDDSLAQPGGMWSSMKGRKRCVVVAQGFYEWLKSGKDKVPHHVKRSDGKLMCFVGLWNRVQYDGENVQYTYTIITTDANKQLQFLHNRMPVLLDSAAQVRTWLDPGRRAWSPDLQDLLRPFEGPLDVYPVSKDVGKVGNDSPLFVVPVASRANKANIANFFANVQQTEAKGTEKEEEEDDDDDKDDTLGRGEEGQNFEGEEKKLGDGGATATAAGSKRKANADDDDEEYEKDEQDRQRPRKKEEPVTNVSPSKKPPAAAAATKTAKKTISSTSNHNSRTNNNKSPAKRKGKAGGGDARGTPKITNFFGGGNSA